MTGDHPNAKSMTASAANEYANAPSAESVSDITRNGSRIAAMTGYRRSRHTAASMSTARTTTPHSPKSNRMLSHSAFGCTGTPLAAG
jgi:hypothetical protein